MISMTPNATPPPVTHLKMHILQICQIPKPILIPLQLIPLPQITSRPALIPLPKHIPYAQDAHNLHTNAKEHHTNPQIVPRRLFRKEEEGADEVT